ncbi:nucleoside recognition domain-containing protein [Natranaerobius trueperi]|uniref:Sporulation integral membrane protein YlbJ n=1 Tax=Natranaerobius trueperi TaxID=759412 RepID=A0A226BWP9_9FIRM|nr:nucleoside recognition domain-containing protein [Natranaerobius trueperi]OWZ83426.1 sporulation integral membrane protein YlbJ [Natranaerobius trueperi]
MSFREKLLMILPHIILIPIFIIIISQPEAMFRGTKNGLSTWWNIILPALLPFFITSDFLMRLGIIHFGGTLLEPVMRPLFNVPGCGAFALILGMTSGAPINGAVTSDLRNLDLVTKKEGERLIAFSSNSSLLFMLSAIPVGMLNQPELGILIASTHIFTNILLGIILGFWSKRNVSRSDFTTNSIGLKKLITKAIEITKSYLRKNKIGFRQMSKEIIANSMTKVLTIGGYIVIFSILIELLIKLEVLTFLSSKLLYLIPVSNIELISSLIAGLFETTVGTKLAVDSGESLQYILTIIVFILGWGGFSIHAQMMTVISDCDLNLKLFIFTRFFQGVISSMLIYFLSSTYLESQVFTVEFAVLHVNLFWVIKRLFLKTFFLLLMLTFVSFVIVLFSSIKSFIRKEFIR